MFLNHRLMEKELSVIYVKMFSSKLGMVVHAVNPSTGEAEVGRYWSSMLARDTQKNLVLENKTKMFNSI